MNINILNPTESLGEQSSSGPTLSETYFSPHYRFAASSLAAENRKAKRLS